jgi:protein TonB
MILGTLIPGAANQGKTLQCTRLAETRCSGEVRHSKKMKRMNRMSAQKLKIGKIAAGSFFAVALSLTAPRASAQESRKAISNPTPAYPEVAKKLHLAGTVKVQVVIAANGQIKEVKVVGGHPVLVSAVEETLKTWKYAPASGETTTQLQFNFHE